MNNTETMQMMSLWIAGQPFSQSRARVTVNGTYSSASHALKAWRATMEGELLKASRSAQIFKLQGPLGLKLVFLLPNRDPASWGKFCDKKPDFDNLAKAVCDCMEKAGLFKVGDQQLAKTEILKIWSAPGEAGVMVELFSLADQTMVMPAKPDWLSK